MTPVLEALQAASPNRFRGIRHSVGWDPHPEVVNRDAEGRLPSAEYRAGAKVLADMGLCLENSLYFPQLQELADFAAGIPDEELLCGGQTKSFLRQAYADELPPAVLVGLKRGFEAPVARWLAEDWRELLHDSLASGARTEQFVSRRFLRDLLADRLAGDRNMPMLKYTLLVLELWLREQEN